MASSYGFDQTSGASRGEAHGHKGAISRAWINIASGGFSSKCPSPYRRPQMPAIELTNPAALPADWRDILALTKPRVMSLVVFTGLCGLLVAPVTASAGARLHRDPLHRARRRRMRRAQPMVRGGYRRQDAAHRQASASRRPDGSAVGASFRRRPRLLLGPPDGACDQLARGALPRRFDPLLRFHLHDVAEAADGAEHRDRRRCRRLPAAHRLGSGDRAHLGAAATSVRHHLPLDSTAFLGAVAVRAV